MHLLASLLYDSLTIQDYLSNNTARVFQPLLPACSSGYFCCSFSVQEQFLKGTVPKYALVDKNKKTHKHLNIETKHVATVKY